MLRVILIRPGETEYDHQGRIQGTLDIPLSEDGRRQIEAIIDQIRPLAPEAIYASPCAAADETAAVLAGPLGLKARPLDKLRNIDHGLWQGMLVDDVKKKQPKVYRQWREQPETVCPPQGEPVRNAVQRVEEALRKVLKRQRNMGTVAIVAPEPVASVVRHVLMRDDLTRFWDHRPRWEVLEVPAAMAPAG